MNPFIIRIEKNIDPFTGLKTDQLETLLNKIAEGKGVVAIFTETTIKESVTKQVIWDIVEIKSTAIRLMNGKSVKVPEKNENGEIIQEVVYYNIPANLTEFQSSMGELILRDFTQKVQGTYDIADPSELIPFVTIALNNLIKYCDGSGNADWNKFVVITQ